MPRLLQIEIKQKIPFKSLEAEAALNIIRTAEALTREGEQMLKPYELTATQYNLLRILRGAGESGATCSEIRERMIKQDPDVSRLLDRMETRGLVRRSRHVRDRRVVTTTISSQGLRKLDELDELVEQLPLRQLEGFSKEKVLELIRDMEKIRNRSKGDLISKGAVQRRIAPRA